MKTSNRWILVALLLTVEISSAQQGNVGRFVNRDGYEQADFGSHVLTFKTPSGDKSVRVSLSKLRLAESHKVVSIRLPQQGTALLQHTAGTVHITVGKERFDPLEGEWMRLTLPVDLRVAVDNDSILMDLTLIEDTRPR